MRRNVQKRIGGILYLIECVAALAAVAVGVAFYCGWKWYQKVWDGYSLTDIIYERKVPVEITGAERMEALTAFVVPPVLLCMLAVTVLFLCLRKRMFFRQTAVLLTACLSLLAAQHSRELLLEAVGYDDYVKNKAGESRFVQEEYVDPRNVELRFPEKKRNLIYIVLESMENTFMDWESGGAFPKNYIPELTQLANENFSFSNSRMLGGAYESEGARWTVASLFSQTSGLPLMIPIARNAMNKQMTFFPDVYSLGNLLEDEGYNQMFMCGSDATFGGRRRYFTTHGNYEIYDYYEARARDKFPRDYKVWWGYEDERLFSYAKEELERLGASEEPFNFTMLTVDTHKESGWVCGLCREENWEHPTDNRYANVLECSSRQVAAFVEWIKEQPFYENTTVILSGDHLTMDADFCQYVPESYDRTVYNAFLNLPFKPRRGEYREYTTMDMFPTTLACLGVEIEGDRLGLGTNLFSRKKTLTEQYGLKKLNKELNKKSLFFDRFTEEIVTGKK